MMLRIPLALAAAALALPQDSKPQEGAASSPAEREMLLGMELKDLTGVLRRGVPPGVGPDADRARSAYFLAAREKLEGFAKKNDGTIAAESARIAGATLALAAGDYEGAAKTLEGVIARLGLPTEKHATLALMDALTWYCEASPAAAKKKLQEIVDGGGPVAENVKRLLTKATASENTRVGKKCVEFTTTTVDGVKLDRSAIDGKVFVLFYWASALPESMRQIDELKRLYTASRGKGLEILGVCMDTNNVRSVPGRGEPFGAGPDAVRRFCQEYRMPWHQVAETKEGETPLTTTFNVEVAPALLLADRKGVWRYVGGDVEQVVKEVRRLLEEK
jgi:hypothetical protein